MKKLTCGLAMPLILSMLAGGCEKAPSVVGSVDRGTAAPVATAEDPSATWDLPYDLPNVQSFDWDRAVAQQAEDMANGRAIQSGLGDPVPTSHDLKFTQPIGDQWSLKAGTAFAVKGAIEYLAGKNTSGNFASLSALDLYYNTRMLAKKSVAADSGATLKDTLDVVTYQAATESFGIAPKTGVGYGIGCLEEADFPYSDTASMDVKVGKKITHLKAYQIPPSTDSTAVASRSAYVLNFTPLRIANPTPGGNVRVIREYLAHDVPVVFGAKIFRTIFIVDPASHPEQTLNTTGVIQMPGTVKGDGVIGTQAFMVVGYEDGWSMTDGKGVKHNGRFILRGSWGTHLKSNGVETAIPIGDRNHTGYLGYFYMPYDYVTPSLVADIWALNSFSTGI